MGKTTRWFRSLLGYKKSSSESSPATSRSEKEKKHKWGLTKSSDSAKGSSRYSNATTTTTTTSTNEDPYIEGLDANKHAIAVAAATAAVAEAALAAAHAAAEVVRLTSGSRSGGGAFACGGVEQQRRELAAIKIQSAFRAYLARRALRALKGLVKLQALVRGRIVRKQSADMLRRMQAMVRIQARACATRAYSSDSSHSTVKSSQFCHPANATPIRYDHQQPPSSFNQNLKRSGSKPNIINHNAGERTYLTSNWLDRWMEECTWNNQRDTSVKHGCGDDDKNDKILEIDTWKPHQNPWQSERNFRSSQYFSAWNDTRRGCSTFEMASRHPVKYQNPDPSLSSGDVSSLRSIRIPPEVDQAAAWNAENSPQVHSANSRPGSSCRRGGFSPSRSECARSFFGDYISYPNYMANTESSRAKFRSQSAPKQRLETGKLGASRNFVRGLWDADTCSEKDSTSHFNYGTKGHSGSARLDGLGTPIRDSSGGFSSSYGVRR